MNNNDENINLGEFFGKYIKHWRIYVPVGIVCLIFAIIFLLITPKKYDITASMQLMSEEDDMKSELKMLGSAGMGGLLGGIGGGSINTENEIAIISSREVLGGAIKESGLQTVTSTWQGLKHVNIDIEEAPVKALLSPEVLDTLSKPVTLKFSVNGDKLENLSASSNLFKKVKLEDRTLPCVITLPIGKIALSRNASGNGNYKLKLFPLQMVYEKQLKALDIEAVEKVSDVITISEKSADVATACRLLNSMMSRYNSYSRKVKVEKTDINARFVKNRLDTVTRELALLEYKIENYKQSNKIPEPTLYASTTYIGNETVDKMIYEAEIRKRMIDYVIDYMSQPENEYSPVPSIDEIGSSELIDYNKQLLYRQRLQMSAENNNPVLVIVEKQIKEQRKMLIETLKNVKENIRISVDALKKKNNTLESKLDKLPTQEREYIEMKRQQKIYETMYLFLMQKLQEKEIANSPDEVAAIIVDKAYKSYRHVFPKASIILIMAFIIACIISFTIISVKLYLESNKSDSMNKNKELC